MCVTSTAKDIIILVWPHKICKLTIKIKWTPTGINEEWNSYKWVEMRVETLTPTSIKEERNSSLSSFLFLYDIKYTLS